MIVEPSLQAVDPLRLAMQSGMLPALPFIGQPLPPIVRPQLLTEQLNGMRGCRCHDDALALPPDYGIPGGLVGLRGLGFDFSTITGGTWNSDAGGYTLSNGEDLGAMVPSAGSGNVSMLNALAMGVNFIPGIGPVAAAGLQATQTVRSMITSFESWLGIGVGRREADLIVPTQNNLMAHLGTVTNQILVTAPAPSLSLLYQLWRDVWMQGVSFMEFVLLKKFTDRRASGQALNTVMPYIDGTCGYAVPLGMTATPSRSNCIGWGAGTVGGDGTNGMLGAIGRAIVQAGGTVQPLPPINEAANSGYQIASTPAAPSGGFTIMGLTASPVTMGVTVLALYLFAKNFR